MPLRESFRQLTQDDSIWIDMMPTSKAIAEETTFLQDVCRRLHCVVLLPCEHRFERPRTAPGKEEVLDDVDRAKRRES